MPSLPVVELVLSGLKLPINCQPWLRLREEVEGLDEVEVQAHTLKSSSLVEVEVGLGIKDTEVKATKASPVVVVVYLSPHPDPDTDPSQVKWNKMESTAPELSTYTESVDEPLTPKPVRLVSTLTALVPENAFIAVAVTLLPSSSVTVALLGVVSSVKLNSTQPVTVQVGGGGGVQLL
jgi:hypothetical protein